MGTLRVYELTEDGYKTLIWRKTGDQGNKWILAEVEVYNRVLYQVIVKFIIHFDLKLIT